MVLQQAQHSDAPRGTLHVTLSHAHGLKAADKGGTSDPYVVLHINTTALLPNLQEVVDMKPSLALLRESKLTQGAQSAIRATVSKEYSALFGIPMQPRRFRGSVARPRCHRRHQ